MSASERQTVANVIDRHRGDKVLQAYVIVSMSRHGVVVNSELAERLNVSAHGLRAMLEPSGLFIVEMLPDPKWGRLCPWFRIDKSKVLETKPPVAGLISNSKGVVDTAKVVNDSEDATRS